MEVEAETTEQRERRLVNNKEKRNKLFMMNQMNREKKRLTQVRQKEKNAYEQ